MRETGKQLWSQRYNDFLSDTVYQRYATASGRLIRRRAMSSWGTGNSRRVRRMEIARQHSMMEEFGRLTFPNSRTASPLIDGDLVIARAASRRTGVPGSGGGSLLRVRQSKKTGEPFVWASSPGGQPGQFLFIRFSGWFKGKRVFSTALDDAAWPASMRAPAIPLWRVQPTNPASTPPFSSTTTTRSSPRFTARPRAMPDGRDENARSRCCRRTCRRRPGRGRTWDVEL